jgi:SAM-dependent methyltransferase
MPRHIGKKSIRPKNQKPLAGIGRTSKRPSHSSNALHIHRRPPSSTSALASQRSLTILLQEATRILQSLIFPKPLSTSTKKRLGPLAEQTKWIVADITQVELEPLAYDVWHDRAVFHFLTSTDQRAAYVRNVARSVRPGGHVIVSTFGPEGPTKCSGLEVMRYDANSLHNEFGVRFRLVESSNELHNTPFGSTQQFLYCYCKVE